MSFKLTTAQIRTRTKDVTRRLGWWFLKPGDIINAVEQCRGLKKGEKVQHLGKIKIISTRPERLHDVDALECIREGFPKMTPWTFIVMFKKANSCQAWTKINRIEFEYMEQPK
jgi:hypothetical protein